MDLNNCFSGIPVKLNLANYFATHPKRASWGPRVLTDYEFVFIVEGEGYYFDNEPVNLQIRKNELVLIPPGISHTVACDKLPGAVISCIHFLASPDIFGRKPLVLNAEPDPEILSLFRKAAEEYDRNRPGRDWLLDGFIREILVRLVRVREMGRQSAIPLKIRQAQHFMELRYKENISRRNISDYLHITPEHLNLLFKRHCATSPMDYLLSLRIKAAKLLLRNPGWNVSEVAREVGFEDPLYFSRVFKKAVGMPPREYAGTL